MWHPEPQSVYLNVIHDRMKKKIVLAGGTGFIGQYLYEQFRNSGYEVIIVSRQQGHVNWDDTPALIHALESADMLINLAGKPISSRFSEANKKALIESRVSTTLTLGAALQQCRHPPVLWLNASGAHIYNASLQHAATESDPADGTSFPALMAQAWEKAFFSFQLPATRQVALRISIVLGKGGGVLQPYLRLARLGLGGRQGNGRQLFSWIHIEDFFRVLLFIREQQDIAGVVNLAAPESVSNSRVMQQIRKTLGVPFGLPAPEWAIRTGGLLLGIEPELILDSLWVYPARLSETGYTFHHPTLESALQQIISG